MKIVFEISGLEEIPELMRTLVEITNNASESRKDCRPIEILHLPERVKNCLKALDIHVIHQLLEWSGSSLIRLSPNMGKKSLADLELALARHGLGLAV